MAARKKVTVSADAFSAMRQRVSLLDDKILILENELKATQGRIQKDMNRLVQMMEQGRKK